MSNLLQSILKNQRYGFGKAKDQEIKAKVIKLASKSKDGNPNGYTCVNRITGEVTRGQFEECSNGTLENRNVNNKKKRMDGLVDEEEANSVKLEKMENNFLLFICATILWIFIIPVLDKYLLQS